MRAKYGYGDSGKSTTSSNDKAASTQPAPAEQKPEEKKDDGCVIA